MRKFVLIVIALTAQHTHASDSDRLVQGNQLAATGQHEEALSAYGDATDLDSAHLLLARAISHAQLGDNQTATEALDALLKQNPVGPIAQRARKAQGALLLQQAAALFSQQPAEAIPLLEMAEQHYAQAHALDRTDSDAARNVEYIRTMLQQAREQEQQQNQQQQQNQEDADKLEELAEQQYQESRENQQQQDQQQQQQDQSDISKQTDQQQQLDQQQAYEALKRAQQSQELARQALERGDFEQASKHQQDAAESLLEAARQLRKDQQQQSQEPSEPDEQQANESQEQESDSLAEQLIDREQEFREQRRPVLKGRPIRVEKDW